MANFEKPSGQKVKELSCLERHRMGGQAANLPLIHLIATN
jgi:hypothetical protein